MSGRLSKTFCLDVVDARRIETGGGGKLVIRVEMSNGAVMTVTPEAGRGMTWFAWPMDLSAIGNPGRGLLMRPDRQIRDRLAGKAPQPSPAARRVPLSFSHLTPTNQE